MKKQSDRKKPSVRRTRDPAKNGTSGTAPKGDARKKTGKTTSPKRRSTGNDTGGVKKGVRSSKRTRRTSHGIKPYYFALISIAVLLVILLVTIPERFEDRDRVVQSTQDDPPVAAHRGQDEPMTNKKKESAAYQDSGPQPTRSLPDPESSSDATTTIPQTTGTPDGAGGAPRKDSPVSEPAVVEKGEEETPGSLAIVIDDDGE